MKDWAKKMDWGACQPWVRHPLVFGDAFHCRSVRVRFFGWNR